MDNHGDDFADFVAELNSFWDFADVAASAGQVVGGVVAKPISLRYNVLLNVPFGGMPLDPGDRDVGWAKSLHVQGGESPSILVAGLMGGILVVVEVLDQVVGLIGDILIVEFEQGGFRGPL